MSAKNLDIAGIGHKGCKVAVVQIRQSVSKKKKRKDEDARASAAAATAVLAELEGKSVRELREIRRGAGIDTSTRSDNRDLVGLIISTATSELCCAEIHQRSA